MMLFELPKGFVRFSLVITATVAASWWVDFELVPVKPSATSFLPLYLLIMMARVVLGLAICGASAGIGMGSVAMSMACFRHLSRIRSPHLWVRHSRSFVSVIVALMVLVVTYGIGYVCIGATGFIADFVMFVGLQSSEFLFVSRILRWRARETIPL
jgi:hypothetical protein